MRYDISEVFAHTVVSGRKTVIWTENTICDFCALNWGIYEVFEVLTHTVVISRKTVKWAENTICRFCALNSRRYESSEVITHTKRISRKTVKWAENTICDTCALNSRRYEIFGVKADKVVKAVKWSKKLWTRVLIILHWTHGDMEFLKFQLLQL